MPLIRHIFILGILGALGCDDSNGSFNGGDIPTTPPRRTTCRDLRQGGGWCTVPDGPREALRFTWRFDEEATVCRRIASARCVMEVDGNDIRLTTEVIEATDACRDDCGECTDAGVDECERFESVCQTPFLEPGQYVLHFPDEGINTTAIEIPTGEDCGE